MQRAGTNEIVDLCSGGTGPWVRLKEEFEEAGLFVNIHLIDKYPDPESLQKRSEIFQRGLKYLAEVVDAMNVPSHLKGMRTLFEGFHHFKPEQAKIILRDAIEKRVAIGIFEASLKPPFGAILLLLAPLTTLASYFFEKAQFVTALGIILSRQNTMTNNVQLRDILETDLPIFFEQQLDPEATQMADFPARGEIAFLAHWTRIMADNSVLLKTILFDGNIAGNIVCFEQAGAREVGYWLGKEYWGKGIATQALEQFLAYVATRPLYAHVAKHNLGSRRVLEKCGFTVSGEDSYFSEALGKNVEEYILKLDASNP